MIKHFSPLINDWPSKGSSFINVRIFTFQYVIIDYRIRSKEIHHIIETS